jgi:hypothetical protein
MPPEGERESCVGDHARLGFVRVAASWKVAAQPRLMCAVTSSDGMTADFYPFDMGFIGRVATASSTR